MNPDYKLYPQLRFMGNKYRLLPWIEDELSTLDFHSVLDAFSGSASVSYLFKTMGRQVYSNDFLNFPSVLSRAVIENSSVSVSSDEISILSDSHSVLKSEDWKCDDFIRRTYDGIFYNPEDLEFLDQISYRMSLLKNPHKRALVMAALIRSCVKKQPRGVFTISGDLSRYDDGRRDLKLSLREHFIEQIQLYNNAVFDNGQSNHSFCGSVFDFDIQKMPVDLVYMDPPYVPRSDDNCYVKRYHFLEGLSKYWKDEEIMYNTKVRKIPKKYTPFSYRGDALDAFEMMFSKYQDSILVLSYSSNGYPDLDVLLSLMEKYKSKVEVKSRDHRYHFGTHDKVKRSKVQEYLIIGK